LPRLVLIVTPLFLVAATACLMSGRDSDPGSAEPRAGDGGAPRELQAAITAGLASLERQGEAWITERKCVSCHQIPVMVWAHAEARERGFPVDDARLDGWIEWSVSETVGSSNADGAYQLLLGLIDALPEERLAGLASTVASRQQADGSWKAGGQLPQQRRPPAESHRVSTHWAIHALATTGAEPSSVARGSHRVRSWLAAGGAAESTETLAVSLISSHHLDRPETQRRFRDELLRHQRADGGWGWRIGEASDALATGQALYALRVTGSQVDEPAVRRGRDFLVSTQRDDGSWEVPGTLAEAHGPVPTSNHWGTGWAVIALLRTLPGSDDRDIDRAAIDPSAALPPG